MGTPELSLDFIPETISNFLGEMTRIESESDDKRLKLEDLVSRFETEVNKIEAFKRELPFCMLLMNHGIVALKEELMVLKRSSANQPVNRTVFEEFIPLKKRCDEERMVETDSGDKKNWLRSTQLWNSDQTRVSERSLTEQGMRNKIYKGQENVMVDDRYQYQYRDFGKELVDDDDKGETLSSGLSLITPGFETPARGNKFLERICGDNNMVTYAIPDVRSDIQIGTPQQPQPPHLQTSRKQRRCWSTELHRRFVNALQQLGGSKAATPKQIRELMNVDGLTNDEVKSHLQKYRLHTKRLSSNSSSVVLRGLWDQSHDHYAENHIHSQSGSPDGPLLNCTITTGGTSTTGGGSMDDGEDEKSETNCWKSYPYTSGKDDV